MTVRAIALALACAAAAAACGSPASPTSLAPQPSASPAPSPAATAAPEPSTAPGSIKVDSAVVFEFQYPGYAGWFYAPQVRVSEASGTGWLRIDGVDISITGHTAWACATGQVVSAGQTRELFAEVYGDYPLTFDKGSERSSGDVRLVIRFGDQAGRAGTLEVAAPITPGALPASYTGGTAAWSCSGAGT